MFLMHLRKFSVKKSDFFKISPILFFLWQIVDFESVSWGFLMHFRPFSVKKKKSDFFPISPIFERFWLFFFDDLLNIGLLPPWNPQFPTGPPLSFYIKNRQKIRKKLDFQCRPPKTDFRFLIYTPKNIYLKKIPFFDVLLPK